MAGLVKDTTSNENMDSYRPLDRSRDMMAPGNTSIGLIAANPACGMSNLDITNNDSNQGGDIVTPIAAGIKDDPSFLRSGTGGLSNDIADILCESDMCDLPFMKMVNMRRGSMEHVKGRVGSFYGQSAIS